MAVEKDQSAWLPEPPPPRPARRDAAIDAALRKFDGVEDAAPAERQGPRRSWASTHRPAFAVLVSAMLLVVVGIPAMLIGIRNSPPPTASSPQAVVLHDAASADLPAREAPPPSAAQAPPAKSAPAGPAATDIAAIPAPAAKVAARNEGAREVAPPALEMEVREAPMAAAVPPAPPPPPPSAARSERDAGASDNVVVTGSQVQNRALAAPSAFEAKTAAQPYVPFLSRLQAAVKSDDRGTLLRLIDFPLRVNFVGGARTYRDAASVQRDFDRIFTAKVRGAVLRQRPDKLFVRDQGAMVGDGELWFRETCNDSTCSPPGPVRIVAVNP